MQLLKSHLQRRSRSRRSHKRRLANFQMRPLAFLKILSSTNIQTSTMMSNGTHVAKFLSWSFYPVAAWIQEDAPAEQHMWSHILWRKWRAFVCHIAGRQSVLWETGIATWLPSLLLSCRLSSATVSLIFVNILLRSGAPLVEVNGVMVPNLVISELIFQSIFKGCQVIYNHYNTNLLNLGKWWNHSERWWTLVCICGQKQEPDHPWVQERAWTSQAHWEPWCACDVGELTFWPWGSGWGTLI